MVGKLLSEEQVGRCCTHACHEVPQTTIETHVTHAASSWCTLTVRPMTAGIETGSGRTAWVVAVSRPTHDTIKCGGLAQGKGGTAWIAWLSSGPSRMAEVPLSMTTEVAATETGLPLMPTPSKPTVQYLHTELCECHLN